MRRFTHLVLTVLAAAAVLATPAAAQDNVQTELEDNGASIIARETHELPSVDVFSAWLEDEKRVARGEVPHFAVALETRLTPWTAGRWKALSQREARWRLRLRSPGAMSMSLAFKRFHLPEGASLTVAATDTGEAIGPFTADDHEDHGELWTPPLLTDSLLVELTVTIDRLDEVEERFAELDLLLARVHHGYAGFGAPEPRSGGCQLDVRCSSDERWYDAARAVGLVSIEGVRFCSGFLVNNTRLDGRPLFLTAHHCGLDEANAASVVVMWNHESGHCRHPEASDALEKPRPTPPRPSRQFQSGAVLRAAHDGTDFALLELDDVPDPDWGLFYAGWDRSGEAPAGATVIHHPNSDTKRLSTDLDRTIITRYLGDEPVKNGDHLRVATWEVGTTEGGSSGAPLFNEAQQVVGHLHGGYASCEAPEEADWFARLASAWKGSGRRGGRLADWLDPLASGTLDLDGLRADELSAP